MRVVRHSGDGPPAERPQLDMIAEMLIDLQVAEAQQPPGAVVRYGVALRPGVDGPDGALRDFDRDAEDEPLRWDRPFSAVVTSRPTSAPDYGQVLPRRRGMAN